MDPAGCAENRRLAGYSPPVPIARALPPARTVAVASTAAAVTGLGVGYDTDWSRPGLLAALAALVMLVGLLPVGSAAVAVGLSVPIAVLDEVPSSVVGVVAMALMVLLAVRVTLWNGDALGDAWRRLPRVVVVLVALMALVVALRAGFAAGRTGGLPALRYFGVSCVLLLATAAIAARREVHLQLMGGFLAGSAISGTVSVMQAVDLPVPRARPPWVDRYPGLSLSTTDLSWGLAVAIVIGLYLLATAGTRTVRVLAGAALVPTSLALATGGAQGGLVGLLFAAPVVGTHFVRRSVFDRQAVRRVLIIAATVVVAQAAALRAMGLQANSVVGLFGDPNKGYVNEAARWDGFLDGLRSLREYPLSGPGMDRYREELGVVPHFVPLEVAVSSGVLGFVVGAAIVALVGLLLFRGPSEDAPLGWLALGVLCVLFAKMFLTTSGPLAPPGLALLFVIAATSMMSAPTSADDRDLVWAERSAAEKTGRLDP